MATLIPSLNGCLSRMTRGENNHSRRYRTGENSIKVVIFHYSSKGLEFPIVAIPGIGYPSNNHSAIKDEVRLIYVGMTRAMDQLILTGHQDSKFGGMQAKVV